MKLPLTATVVCFFISLLPVFGAGADRVVLSERPAAMANLTPIGNVPDTNVLTLALGLPLRDPAGLDDLISQIYNPSSTNFHRFLTPPELAERFGPTAADYLAVRQFAESNGLAVAATYPNRMVLDVTGTAGNISRAFQIRLYRYHHPVEPRDFYAPDTDPSVPVGVNVISVEGLTDFNRPKPAAKKVSASTAHPLSFSGTGPNHEYMGYDFRNAYVPGTALMGAGQTVALLEYADYYKVDITNYENAVGASFGVTNYVPLTNVVVGGTVPSTGNNSEVALDIEMAVAMAPKLSRVIVYEQSAASSSVLSQIQSDNLARQVSSSWTVGPWSTSTANTWDNILKLMIAQGQSYFQSAGDSDAYTGTQPLDSGTTVPADSPYATIVGGTTLTMTSYGVAWSSETVWNYNLSGIPNEGSGGGVSTYYAIPSWQTNVSMANNSGSTSFRNIPDVALTADNIYVCYNNGDTGGSSYFMGTSAAAPLWAGFTALVNQQAIQGGLAPIGFINPAVYGLATNTSYGSMFHDITTGNNIGTNTPGLYNAVANYDLCTGLGSPRGTNLINALAPVAYSVAITNGNWSLITESGTPADGMIDPGETVTVSFTLQNQGNLSTANLVATLLASTNVLAPSAPQSYGALAPYGGSSNRLYTFTAAGTCGSLFPATFQLQDGTNNLGTVSFTLLLGSSATSAQNFDAAVAPALPSGWSSSTLAGAANPWTTTTSAFDTSPNSAFNPSIINGGENVLVSPAYAIAITNAQLSFRQNYSLKFSTSGHGPNQVNTYYDGGVLEIKIGSGAFTDIVTAGGSFVSGGYNKTIATGTDNPLGGRTAWTGSSGGWISSTVNLPAAAAGQTIQLRWNYGMASTNISATGWNVDTVSLSGVANCSAVFCDVAVSQSIAPASLTSGQNLVYTLSLTNLGPQSAANLVVTDAIPANATFVSAPGGIYSGGQVAYAFGTLPANATTNFTLTVTPTSGNVFTNTATAATITPDLALANNTATLIVTQSAGVAPTITAPPVAQTIQCGSNASFSVTATGSAPLRYQWSLDGAAITAATNTSLTLSNVHLPSHTVAVVVTNLYGSATNSVPLTVQDTLPPTITLNSTNPFYVQLGSAYVEPGATAYDLCMGSVAVSISGTVNTAAVSTNTVFYTATDSNGNSNTTPRTVVVQDTTPPTITWSFTNLMLTADSNCVASMPDVTGTNYILATDNSGSVTITQTPTNNAVVALGTNVIVITVADASGNKSFSTNRIAVLDQTPPVLALNGTNSMTIELGGVFVDPGVTASDSCSGIALLTTNGSVNVNAVGTNWLTYTATDGSGNTNAISRVVIVQDTTPPTISWSFTNLVLAANSNCVALMPDVTGTNYILATDLSGALTITQNPTNNSGLPLGTNIVVLTVADSSGNAAYSTNWIAVQDLTAPVITLNGANPMTVELGSPFVDPGASASDVCSGVALFSTNGSVNVNAIGTNWLTYNATDGSGNTNAIVRMVIVRDTTPPTISWSFTNLVLAANSNCVALMPDVTGTNYILATDLSGALTITQNLTNNSGLPLGTNMVVLTVADASGNTAYSTNWIAVTDQTPPRILTQPQSQTVNAGGNASFSVSATACTPLSFQWFFGNSALIAETNSTLTLSNVSTGAAGNYQVVVAANGGATTSTVAVLTIVSPASLALTSSANPAGFKDSLTFSATVTPTGASGSVQFLTNAVLFDTEPLSGGVATSSSLDSLPRGTNSVTALYSGDANFLPATNSLAEIVTNHPPVVLPAFYSIAAGQSLTILVSDLATNWSDFDGDTLFISDISTSTNGVVITNTLPSLFYSNSNLVNDQFTCAISDGFGGTNFETITITLMPATNTTPVIASISAESGGVTLQLNGAYGSTYVLESSTNLVFGPWAPLDTNSPDATGTWQFTDVEATNIPSRFYRLKLQP